jgi:DNA mismatch repair protein MutL
MTIHILPQAIRQRIAAGEVVERPASAVKELVENSIDAGAHAISVEVLDGGLSLIRVADDGCGMNRVDAQLCVERFSTSKLHALSDLDAIRTLGFRGEALSSIIAVAHVEILTRTVDEIEGTRVHASEDTATVEPAASPVGTSVTVRGLFAHVPARRRFLKSRTRETELIQKTVDSFALAYPEIAFRLIVDDRERLVAPHATPLARVGAVLGRDVAGEMIALQWQALDLSIEGFISRPTIGRSRRSGQYFFVNGRPIRPGLLAVMLERPYSGRLPPGRHPLAVVYISLAPPYVDVNVHPRKAEVRFAQERTVYGAVASAVSDALHEYPRNVGEGDIAWPFGSWPGQVGAIREGSAAYNASELRALAQLHNTYILAQTPDGLAVADQHAAHEQVLFEHISRGGEQLSLSPPARLHLTPQEADTLERIAPLLGELGIEVEPFGGRTFLVRSLPAPLGKAEPDALLTALIAEGARQRGSDDEQRDRLAMKAACQCAVKAGDPLTYDQMQQLLDDLAQAWSPATCPHGRPALVSLSLEELAQRFGR